MNSIPAEKIRSLQQLFNRIIASKTTEDKLPKFALLAGAGCSISSGVASGKRMIDILQKHNYLLHSDNNDAGLLARWDHEKETLETFISKIEHSIDTSALQEYILAKADEHKQLLEDVSVKSRLLNTLPNSLKKRHKGVFKKTEGKWLEIPDESVDDLWQEYHDFFLSELLYGFWMYQHSPISDNIQALIEEFIEYKNPSVEYYVFADLIAKGMLYNVFTTNFDDFFQEALSFLGLRARVCAFDDKASVIKFTRKKPNIIKLHGDYLYSNTKNYNSETSELHKDLRSKFQEALMRFGLVVVGYAGNDYSIMSVVEELKEDLDYPLYWCVLESDLKNETIPWRVKELILNTNSSYFVPIKDFGQFTEFLWGQWHQAEEISQRQADSFITRAFEKAAELSEQLKIILSGQKSEKQLLSGILLDEIAYDYSKLDKPPIVSPFIAFNDELATVQENGFVHLQQAVSFFNNLDIEKKTLARHVIKFVGDYVFLNSRYLTFLINLDGFSVSQEKVTVILKQLSSVNILSQYRFSTPKMTSNFYIFSLAYSGDKLYKQLFKIKPQWNDTLKLTSAINIKRYLATAQALSVIKQIAKIDCQISPRLGNSQGGVRPSALFRNVKDNIEYTYLLEIVRQKTDWESDILEKLNRYNGYMSNARNANTYLVLCGEDKTHMEAIFYICESWRETARDKMITNQITDRKVWFTHDIAFLSHKLVNTFSLLYKDDHDTTLALPIDLESFFVENGSFINDDEISEIVDIHDDSIEKIKELASISDYFVCNESCGILNETPALFNATKKTDDEPNDFKKNILLELDSAKFSRTEIVDELHTDFSNVIENAESSAIVSEGIKECLNRGEASSNACKDNQEIDETGDIPYEYTHNGLAKETLKETLKEKIIRTCLSFGNVGQPIELAKFALALKGNGVNYQEYGFSKLIQLLQNQDSYICIEGSGTNKYIKLIDVSSLGEEFSQEQGKYPQNELGVQNTASLKKKQPSPDVSVLFHNVYLGDMRSLLKSLGSMAGCYISLDILAQNFKSSLDVGRIQYATGFMTFYTGYQHPARGKVFMRCVNNERAQPWKFDSFFYQAIY